MTFLMRKNLVDHFCHARGEVSTHMPHPGLLIQRGLLNVDDKASLITDLCHFVPDNRYKAAYDRWKCTLQKDGGQRAVELNLESRLFSGLSGGGALETGCTVSHSYGTPCIPGSTVKGVVSAHAAARLRSRSQGNDIWTELFGNKGLSGLIRFHDAWWVPDSADHPFVKEIVTTHHQDYYRSEGRVAATDYDSPVPNLQIAVRGSFLFGFQGPDDDDWLDLVQNMLTDALVEVGVGAKTRAGYGAFRRPKTGSKHSHPPCDWVDTEIAELGTTVRGRQQQTPHEALRGVPLAKRWQNIQDERQKREAYEDIRARWEDDPKLSWEDPQGRAPKRAREIYREFD